MTAAVGMPCPICRVPLVMSERQGVEIDYCPQCRGVWLDRGELDKIIERSAAELGGSPTPAAPPPPPPYPSTAPSPWGTHAQGNQGYAHDSFWEVLGFGK